MIYYYLLQAYFNKLSLTADIYFQMPPNLQCTEYYS